MNVLMINPKIPATYWSFKHALSFIGKKAAFPPLGLLTVAAMLPENWTPRLVDANVRPLRAKDLEWADLAMVGGMMIQREHAHEVIRRCKAADLTIIGGGPLFTCEPESFPEVDHLVLNEAEVTLPRFIADWESGAPKARYESDRYPSMEATPVPRWDLINPRHYASMSLQFSRGCPFDCEFCNVTALLGHRPRIKSVEQILAELDAIRLAGWRSPVFFVDDNFIGNKHFLRRELLPALEAWQSKKPGISFYTEASINLSDDPELMEQMVRAGFNTVFVGIETPSDAGLAECNKRQNRKRDLLESVSVMQRAGLQVQGGFIVGFDSDGPGIFQEQVDFIQRSGIVMAMVGLLQAPVGTRLYERLKAEGRIKGFSSGDNTGCDTNISPKMGLQALQNGYRQIFEGIYLPKPYYRRVRQFLREYRPPQVRTALQLAHVRAFIRSVWRLGLFGRERFEYWKLLGWTAWHRRELLPMAVTMSVMGFHFRKVYETQMRKG